MKRTDIQRCANEIDMDLRRLSDRIFDLAQKFPIGKERFALMVSSDMVQSARGDVRKHMHPEDVASTT